METIEKEEEHELDNIVPAARPGWQKMRRDKLGLLTRRTSCEGT